MFGVNVDNKPLPPQPCVPTPPVPPVIPKPKLRGQLTQALKTRLIGLAVLLTTVGVSMYVFRTNARSERYAEFERTYPPDMDFERMKRAGVFHAINRDGSVGDL